MRQTSPMCHFQARQKAYVKRGWVQGVGRAPHQTEAIEKTMPLGLAVSWEMTSCMVLYSGDSPWKCILLDPTLP